MFSKIREQLVQTFRSGPLCTVCCRPALSRQEVVERLRTGGIGGYSYGKKRRIAVYEHADGTRHRMEITDRT